MTPLPIRWLDTPDPLSRLTPMRCLRWPPAGARPPRRERVPPHRPAIPAPQSQPRSGSPAQDVARRPPAVGRELGTGLADPGDGAPFPQGKIAVRTLLQREPEHRALLGLGIDDETQERGDNGVEPGHGVLRRVIRQERAPLDLRVRGDQQRPAASRSHHAERPMRSWSRRRARASSACRPRAVERHSIGAPASRPAAKTAPSTSSGSTPRRRGTVASRSWGRRRLSATSSAIFGYGRSTPESRRRPRPAVGATRSMRQLTKPARRLRGRSSGARR